METLGVETSTPCPNSSDTFPRRLCWTLCGLVCVTVFGLAASAAGRPETQRDTSVLPDASALQEAVDDPVYDSFLQEFGALRANAARRRYLAAEVVSAAASQQIDPDLLFALVAAESSFNHTAVSTKGARGLGQLMFPTARAVAPTVVRRPDDLYSVRRNLHVTAQHLRQLLLGCDGDLRQALIRYNAGPYSRRAAQREASRYVAVISTYFATLKVKRGFQELVAMGDGTIATAEK